MFVNHILGVSKIWLTLLLGLLCVIGDNFVASAKGNKLIEALVDNATHGLVGALSTLIIVIEFSDRVILTEQKMLIGAGFLIASAIDLDHFIAAKSLRLRDATSLESRPFLHYSNIPFIMLLVFLICIHFKSFRLNLWLAVLFTAFMTHHIRDATRRGFWIQPYGHTPPIPYGVYLMMTMATPLAVIWLINAFRSKFSVVYDNYHRVYEV